MYQTLKCGFFIGCGRNQEDQFIEQEYELLMRESKGIVPQSQVE
jgi:hypothetical protein